MRVFLAGATGAIGRRLVPMLLEEGHQVTGMTRSAEKADAVQASGAEPAVCDALDRQALTDAVRSARPDAVVHQLTAIPQRIDPRKIERDFALTDRLRTEGTHNLLAAARAAEVSRIVAQSVAFVYEPTDAGSVHGEDDPLYRDAPPAFERTLGAVKELERAIAAADGTVLRYGYFYGSGTAISSEGSFAAQARRRQLPVVGGGTGVWPFIHIDDAARATVAALAGPAGVYNIVDDDPAPVSDWIPSFCHAVGAPKPLRVPAWLARLAAGSYGVLTMTSAEGASNARAKQQLGWTPRYPSWREGFRTALNK